MVWTWPIERERGDEARLRTEEMIPAVNVADPKAPSGMSYSRLKKRRCSTAFLLEGHELNLGAQEHGTYQFDQSDTGVGKEYHAVAIDLLHPGVSEGIDNPACEEVACRRAEHAQHGPPGEHVVASKRNTTDTHKQRPHRRCEAHPNTISKPSEEEANSKITHESQSHEQTDLRVLESQRVEIQRENKRCASIAEQSDEAQQDQDLEVSIRLPEDIGANAGEEWEKYDTCMRLLDHAVCYGRVCELPREMSTGRNQDSANRKGLPDTG
ncbi:hypothetical protein HG530_007140 [Fusarium avenaceum]|nr:hypothetical protein HG530_007140 [Fusarium avenaceum]